MHAGNGMKVDCNMEFPDENMSVSSFSTGSNDNISYNSNADEDDDNDTSDDGKYPLKHAALHKEVSHFEKFW